MTKTVLTDHEALRLLWSACARQFHTFGLTGELVTALEKTRPNVETEDGRGRARSVTTPAVCPYCAGELQPYTQRGERRIQCLDCGADASLLTFLVATAGADQVATTVTTADDLTTEIIAELVETLDAALKCWSGTQLEGAAETYMRGIALVDMHSHISHKEKELCLPTT
jgi:hypothetical protein